MLARRLIIRLLAVWMTIGTCAWAAEVSIFDNGNIAAVSNNPSAATTFSIAAPALVNSILTYHWNNGKGATPGSIGLKHSDGTLYGPWAAIGQNGNINWYVYPKVVIKVGAYTVLDSEPATWAWNSGSANAGMTVIKGEYQSGSAATLAAPQAFTQNVSNNQLLLNWQAVSGAAGYTLLIGQQSGVYPISITLPITPTSLGPIDISGVAAGIYYLALKATAGASVSTASNELSIVWAGVATTPSLPSGFQVGASQSYTISPGKAFTEALSGAQITPSASASGSITVQPIATAPFLPTGGKALLLSATAADAVDIAISHAAGDEVLLRLFASPVGSKRAARWMTMAPTSDSGGVATFRVPLSSSKAAARAGAGRLDPLSASAGIAGSSAILSIPTQADLAAGRTSQLATQRAAIRAAGEAVLNKLISQLNATQQQRVAQARLVYPLKIVGQIDGGVDCDSHRYPDPDTSAYTPWFQTFWGYVFGATTTGTLELCGSANAAIHEAGHYLHHLLAGNAAFQTILNQSLNTGASHVPGQTFDRRSVVEDYAYLFEMMAGGSLAGWGQYGSGFSGSPFDKLFTTGLDPVTNQPNMPSRPSRDYPSMEGFFAALVGGIIYNPSDGKAQRTVTIPYQLDGSNTVVTDSVPVIGGNWPLAMDFVVSRGIASADALWSLIQPLGAPVAVIAERYGWSYFGHGKVVDATGQGVSGVTVQPACRTTDSGNFVAPSATTASDGSFRLTRIFPGEACVLVVTGADAKANDWKVTLDAQKPTSTDVDLGSYTLAVVAKITNISPSSVVAGSGATITVTGSGFGASNSARKLYLGSAQVIWSTWSDSSITFVLPASTAAGTNAIYVSSGGVDSNKLNLTVTTPTTTTTPTTGTVSCNEKQNGAQYQCTQYTTSQYDYVVSQCGAANVTRTACGGNPIAVCKQTGYLGVFYVYAYDRKLLFTSTFCPAGGVYTCLDKSVAGC